MFPAKTTVKLIKGFRSLIQADNFKLGKWKSHPVVNFPAKILKLFGFLRIMEIERYLYFQPQKNVGGIGNMYMHEYLKVMV